MGYFDFVSPDLGPDDVPDDEATNAENQAFEQSHAAAAKTPTRFNLDETDETHEFQKKRSQLSDFAKKQALTALEKLANKQATTARQATATGGGFGAPQGIDLAGLEQKIKSSSPDQLATILFNEAQKHAQGKDLDDILTPVEDAVQNYKRLTIQQQPQAAQQIQSSLAAQDLPGKQARAKQLDQEIDKANKDLQIAASPRQAQKIKENIQFLNDQKRQLGLTSQPTEEQPAPQLDLKGDIDSNIKAAGRNPRDFRLAMVAAAKTLEEKTGLDTMALKDRVPFQRALLSALQIFDPAGIIVSQLAQDMQPSAPPAQQEGQAQTQPQGKAGPTGSTQDATATSTEEDQHTQNIRKMQADRRALYNELGQTPELQNWLGVLTFVFLSVITRSPAVAASILGISRRQGNLKMQLDLIEKEMHEEGGMLRDAQKRTEFNRKLAAEHALRKEDKADDFQREIQKMYLNHKLILQREAARHPENANAYKQLENSFVRQKSFYDKAQHKKDEAQRILSNDFSDENLKAQAQKDFNAAQKEMNFYASRLRDLDAEIRKQGGIQFSDEMEESTK